MLGRYFNACNVIENNFIRQSDLVLEKYLVTHSGYFRLENIVEFSIGITYGNALFCHDISMVNRYKKIKTREYNNMTVYDCFNNPFTSDYGNPSLNNPPMYIDDSTHLVKVAQYNPDPLSAAIYVASENSVSTLTTPSKSLLFIVLNSDDPSPLHYIKKDEPYHGRVIIGY